MAAPKVLHFGNMVDPQEIDPQLTAGVPEFWVCLSLLEGLVGEDGGGNITPAAARSWEVSADGRVYTFHLRPEARWSNGRAVTATDFVRSYQRVLTPSLAAPNAERLYVIAGAEDFHRGRSTDLSGIGVKALDPHSLQITLQHPAPFLLRLMAGNAEWLPVPVDVIEKNGPADRRGNRWTRPGSFVGNGPFILKEWTPGQRIVVTRSPTYWDRTRTKLDEIQFYPVESPAVEERMFRSGQLNITSMVPLAKIASYRREPPSPLRTDPLAGLYMYMFNTKCPPFTDARVRRAFAYAIDRESLVRNVTLGGELPAYHLVPPTAGYQAADVFKADPAEARRLLAEAGYPEGRGLPPIEILYNTSENHRAIAEAIQQMWRKTLGVNATLVNQEWKVYLDTTHSTHDFQVARAGWVDGEPYVHLDRWSTGHAMNDAQWSNAEYDRLLQKSLEARTDPERFAVYQQMEKVLNDEMPVAPIYFQAQPRLVSPKVRNFRPSPDEFVRWQDVDLGP